MRIPVKQMERRCVHSGIAFGWSSNKMQLQQVEARTTWPLMPCGENTNVFCKYVWLLVRVANFGGTERCFAREHA